MEVVLIVRKSIGLINTSSPTPLPYITWGLIWDPKTKGILKKRKRKRKIERVSKASRY